jgi:arylsulfatase A-like enzyme
LILTDDERWDRPLLTKMPNINSMLIQHGVNLSNAFVVNSLCCPSRASILTGEYSHSTLVYDNGGAYGGFSSFDDSSTVPIWLQGAGYRTSLMGKYLNGYNSLYVPPGWDHWFAFKGAPSGVAYYDYDINNDGAVVHYGSQETDYSTDVLAGEADSFIRGTNQGQPLFLYLALPAPHVPTTPPPRYANRFNNLQPYRPPNYNEVDVSDKPAWVQALAPLTPEVQSFLDDRWKNIYRTLLGVDDAVGEVVTALQETGRLSNTLIVLASDNGWTIGEHRWRNKKDAWEESIRIPMIARYDPLITAPRVDRHLALNIDLAPTFAELAGVPAPGVDGVSLVPLLTSPNPGPWRKDFLIEHLGDSGDEIPTFCAVRDVSLQPQGFTYVLYRTGEEELYDLKTDFYELQNLVSDPLYASQLTYLRGREAVLCDPPPPGWP